MNTQAPPEYPQKSGIPRWSMRKWLKNLRKPSNIPPKSNNHEHLTTPSSPHPFLRLTTPSSPLSLSRPTSQVIIPILGHGAWGRLGTSLRTLESQLWVLPPLKPAISAFIECLDTIQIAALNRADHEKLAEDFQVIIDALIPHTHELASGANDGSIADIIQCIGRQVEGIKQLGKGGATGRLLDVTNGQEDVIERYREIERLFRQLQHSINSSQYETDVHSQHARPLTKSHQVLRKIIDYPMQCADVARLLMKNGCSDLTASLKQSACSDGPIVHGGSGDVFYGNLRDGTPVAIKTIRDSHTSSTMGRLYHNLKSESICDGLSYLHDQGIAHGDLKGVNVLIDEKGRPMLTDFGNASLKDCPEPQTEDTETTCTLRWAAPEIINGGSRTTAADVYSLGMTILETFTSAAPFAGKSDLSLVRYILVNRKTPTRPEQFIPSGSVDGDKLWVLLMKCWSYDPKDRPNARFVRNSVKAITAGN